MSDIISYRPYLQITVTETDLNPDESSNLKEALEVQALAASQMAKLWSKPHSDHPTRNWPRSWKGYIGAMNEVAMGFYRTFDSTKMGLTTKEEIADLTLQILMTEKDLWQKNGIWMGLSTTLATLSGIARDLFDEASSYLIPSSIAITTRARAMRERTKQTTPTDKSSSQTLSNETRTEKTTSKSRAFDPNTHSICIRCGKTLLVQDKEGGLISSIGEDPGCPDHIGMKLKPGVRLTVKPGVTREHQYPGITDLKDAQTGESPMTPAFGYSMEPTVGIGKEITLTKEELADRWDNSQIFQAVGIEPETSDLQDIKSKAWEIIYRTTRELDKLGPEVIEVLGGGVLLLPRQPTQGQLQTIKENMDRQLKDKGYKPRPESAKKTVSKLMKDMDLNDARKVLEDLGFASVEEANEAVRKAFGPASCIVVEEASGTKQKGHPIVLDLDSGVARETFEGEVVGFRSYADGRPMEIDAAGVYKSSDKTERPTILEVSFEDGTKEMFEGEFVCWQYNRDQDPKILFKVCDKKEEQ